MTQTLIYSLRLGFQADNHAGFKKQVLVLGVDNSSTAGSYDRLLFLAGLLQYLTLQTPEFILSVLFEDFRNSFAAELNYFIIGINKCPVQALSHLLSNDGFTGS